MLPINKNGYIMASPINELREGFFFLGQENQNEIDSDPSSVTLSPSPQTPIPFDFDLEFAPVEFHDVPPLNNVKLSSLEQAGVALVVTVAVPLFWYFLNYYFNPQSNIYFHFTLRM